MILLQGFLEVLFKALILLGMALSMGGVVFNVAVLRPWEGAGAFPEKAIRRSVAIITLGAAVAALSQLMFLLLEPWAFADESGRWPVAAFLATDFARAGLIRAFLAACLAGTSLWLLGSLRSRSAWMTAGLEAMLLMISGAWLVHAVSRLENVVPLMIATAVHQAAAVVWVGGVIQCVFLRNTLRASGGGARQEAWARQAAPVRCTDAWPVLTSRFSPLAMVSVAVVISTGLYLAVNYIGDWEGLIGTAYGAMVLTKIVLLGFAMCLGGFNTLSIRRWKRSGRPDWVNLRVPAFVESEAGTGAVILLAAAALTSQPPAMDVTAERASPMEVISAFAPKIPQLIPPDYREMLARSASSLDPFAVSGALDRVQSNFNHNISGIFVLIAGFLALLDRTGKWRWTKHWPLVFLLLALFLLLLGEPNGWPLGYEGFWETLISPGVLEHRLATLVVICLAVGEWRVRAGKIVGERWSLAFPVLCFAGGALLLTHSHSLFASKWAFLIETSHNAIGFLAVLIGAGRWLELRLPAGANRFPAYLWPACMMLVGFVLLFYREM